MAGRWRVLVEHEYDRGDLGEIHVGDDIWLTNSAGKLLLVKVQEILPADDPQYDGTLIARSS